MRLYSLDIHVKTPMQLGDVSIGNVYKNARLKYIPGQTIKGAILSKLYIEYGVSDVRSESTNPRISIRPAYPVVSSIEARPPHPLIYRCKLCRGDESIFYDEVFKDVKSLRSFNYSKHEMPYKCGRGHLYAVEVARSLLIFGRFNGEYRYRVVRDEDIGTTQLESIGINRALGGTELGMIYSYIVIRPGVHFKTLLFDREDIFEKKGWASNLMRKDTYYIGRGSSRGTGIVEIEFKEIDYGKYIEDRIDEIRSTVKKLGGLVILRALSPIANRFKDFNIDLANYNLEPYTIYETVFNDKVLNFNYIPTGLQIVKGYSSKTGLPKLSVRSLSPGSLYFYVLKDMSKLDDVSKSLAELELSGFTYPYYLGFNYLEVYTDVGFIL